MPSLAIAAAKCSGVGSGWRPGAPSPAGAARSRSRSTNTAPGTCPAAYASRPDRPSRYQRTSHTTAPGCAASQPVSTNGGINVPVREPVLVVAEGVDELILAHLGASLDADLGGALLEVVLRPVLVGRGPAAA